MMASRTGITDRMKKLFIKTFGCQMNVYDSERMADALMPSGYMPTDAVEDADMVILNTCHIREKAAEKVYSDLGRLRGLKKRASEEQNRQMLIAVAGCVAQAEGAEITRRAPWVDMVVGPQTYHRLPELVAKIDPEARTRLVDTEFPAEVKFDFLPEEQAPRGPAAFLSVQEGCDKFCSFCVVPYTRGAEFSRPAQQIIAEAKRLAASGSKEITLLGQNVNAWHGEAQAGQSWGLGRLIRELAEIDGIERLRYTTSHPLDMDDDLMTAHKDVPVLMPYLHLPVQAGSDRILAAMNRRHTADDYLKIIDRLRELVPHIALSGDFIVGFPGETDRDFADTIKLVDKVGYASAYSFKYSARPGTPASSDDEQIDEQVKSERLTALQQLLDAQQLAFNRNCANTQMVVLMEKQAGRDGQLSGRSPFMQSVYVEAPLDEIGKMKQVIITDTRQNSLTGEFV
jgi:tRNA-2-methylthio-N6-dimethylallyladenosine synthase